MTSTLDHWDHFLTRYYPDEMLDFAEKYPGSPEKPYKTFIIDYKKVSNFDPELADELLDDPKRVTQDLTAAILEFDLPISIEFGNVYVGFINLPEISQVSTIRERHAGKLVVVEGMVSMASEIKPKITNAAFQCQRCGFTFFKEQDGLNFNDQALRCQNQACDRGGPFRMLPDRSTFVNAQRLRIQDTAEFMRGGEKPATIEVEIIEDFVGKIHPGDKVQIVGIMATVQDSKAGAKSTYFSFVLKSTNFIALEQDYQDIVITQEDEDRIKALAAKPDVHALIAQSIARSIKGFDEVKEALALVMASSPRMILPDGVSLRGTSHVLLVGDPGVAKSQLLRYVADLAPHGHYASGKSTTAAGLTATAVKDAFGDGSWALEPGLLVRAHGGLAALDELDKLPTEDLSALHEALEQNTVSVAKAGIVAKMKAEFVGVCAANPKKSRFDRSLSIADQIKIPLTILTRFDLIFIIEDIPSKDRDGMIADHILKGMRKNSSVFENILEPDFIKKYIAYCKRIKNIYLSEDAEEVIKAFYIETRGSTQDTIPVTARQLEALARLSKASARLALRDIANEDDAKRAVALLKFTLDRIGVDPSTGQYDSATLEAGRPHSQIDRTARIEEIIRTAEAEFPRGVPLATVQERAKLFGIDPSYCIKLISKMRETGTIFEKANEKYAVC